VTYAIGQRWISHADTELGLGIIVAVETRRVSVLFPAVGEERTYAADGAPLTRLRLHAGDTLRTDGGDVYTVDEVIEEQGLLHYRVEGVATPIGELELDPHIELATPRQRLLAGQFDSHAAFALRLATCAHIDRLQRSGLRGLLGTRTALLPHQLHVANEVGRRPAPRVLLADEVGLGKTIEAGMILHRQLLTGAATRVLVLVPDSLQYQWLVEMRRRFNLAFAVFDAERISAQTMDNPFDSEQLVLCAMSLFTDNALYRELALDARWDLVIVDEAHRLHWQPGQESDAFRFLRELSQASPGLLLLTATPEQVGQEAHFARLALLDPARFTDLHSFRAEEQRYRQWSDAIAALERGDAARGLPADIDPKQPPEQQIEQLIDRYGTGRVLFRNTRAAVGGFPERVVRRKALRWEDAPRHSLYPEREASMAADENRWLDSDPRVAWLIATLRDLRPAKVLVICAHAETAVALEAHLQLRAGVRAAAFHEGLNLVERDRAAAWFADFEQGAQALVCSEIGSEGRNFQFAQHLVLFDLPRHPDQLEQRIGRLDRIGQRERITLHLPYLEGTAQEVLLRWYDEGLDILRSSCSAGDMILEHFASRLDAALRGQLDKDALEALIDDTATFSAATKRELSEGRDRLLERSSCNLERGEMLAAAIAENEDPGVVGAYLESLCDVAGVEHEEHSEHCSILRRGEQERLPLFPELSEEGVTVTVSRQRALEREDFTFLSWEHPWMDAAMGALLNSTLGQASIGTLSLRGVAAGSRIYEFLFTISLSAPSHLQLSRYLPLSPQRLVFDGSGRDLTELLPSERLERLLEKLPRGAATKIVRRLQTEIETRLRGAEDMAAARLEAQREAARSSLRAVLGAEIERLRALRERGSAVRDDEIETLTAQLDAGEEALNHAQLRLEGMRLVVTR
jgi:ATP-dependent helicase HepA